MPKGNMKESGTGINREPTVLWERIGKLLSSIVLYQREPAEMFQK